MYPDPLKVTYRRWAASTVLAASGFKRMGKINFGARMAIFNYNKSLIVWSAIPLSEETEKAIKEAAGNGPAHVTHLIIPDREHTLAACSYKAKYPEMKIIAMDGVDLGPDTPIDYVIGPLVKNTVLDKKGLSELGLTDSAIVDNFQFVYIPDHANAELVMYDKNTKTVYEADLLFNLRTDTQMEQFSPQLGHSPSENPFGGWSFPSRYLHPDSKVGRYLFRRIAGLPKSLPGLKAIHLWDFDSLVMCHGNVIEQGAKDKFALAFGL